VMNFTDADTPYTRVIEHKHFEFKTQPYTYVTREYPLEWTLGGGLLPRER
jgi:UDP-galactopyranose mutase